MQTRIGTAQATGSAQDATTQAAAALRKSLSGHAPALVMAFASTTQSLREVSKILTVEFPNATVLGSSTAGEFTHQTDAKGSLVLWALAGDFKVTAGIGTGLKADPDAAVKHAVESIGGSTPGYPHRTALVLLDALSGSSEEVALSVALALGGDIAMAGGAAGDDLQMKSPLVSLGERVATDAVVVAVLESKTKVGIGIAHGHKPLSRPLKVTRATGNVVHEIDGRPAWDVWVENTADRARAAGFPLPNLPADRVTPFLLNYEAGLATGDDFKIRAPLSKAEDGSISFACGIDQGTTIRITESVAERQVESAKEAARRAKEALGGAKAAGALVFDCICRNLILGDQFKGAVQGMSKELGGAPIAGFETYGEIALQVGEMSGFHNTTSVVLAFAEG